jgi:hypothetical protein
MNERAAELAERLRKPFSGPMTDEEIEFLRDAQAMIEFAIRNGLSFATVVSTLGHDLNEVARNGFDLGTAKQQGFRPKVAGYSKLSEDDFADAEGPSA